jgi:PIN domain nuclease of toxin-antitoxin system
MRLLLDTHSFLWFVDGSPQLSAAARILIEDAVNDVFLSVASVWEIAIKIGAGKLDLGQPIERRIPEGT